MSDDRVEAQLDYWRDVSWTAIIFGALLALSVSVMLHILGIGVTASLVDTNQRASDALTTLGNVSGIWNLVSTAVSLFIGGFVASTLARTFTSGRAAIYGLGVWAITTLVATAVIVPTLKRCREYDYRSGYGGRPRRHSFRLCDRWRRSASAKRNC